MFEQLWSSIVQMWNNPSPWMARFRENLDAWAVLGAVAQLAFTGRFVVQWIASERQKKSVIPVTFWHLSVFGSTGLLIYAIARADPLLIAAFALNNFIYIRNLMFIYRERAALRKAADKAS